MRNELKTELNKLPQVIGNGGDVQLSANLLIYLIYAINSHSKTKINLFRTGCFACSFRKNEERSAIFWKSAVRKRTNFQTIQHMRGDKTWTIKMQKKADKLLKIYDWFNRSCRKWQLDPVIGRDEEIRPSHSSDYNVVPKITLC